MGKFELLLKLGQGGMATVYLARAVAAGGFQRLVAIKLMHQFLGSDDQFVEMFLDEARVAANIRHPNVVSIVDLGNEADHLYMVMDYVEGDTLAAVEGTAARLGRAIPLGVVLRIVLDSLSGLEAAHELKTPDGLDLKVVHRDVSPQNILVGVDGAARLTDFGIARAEQRIATTRTGMLKGKAPFMAPEQFEGRPVDRRADVFAMGVTLWEAIALRRLFPGRESYEQALRNTRGPYRKLKEILPSVPASLDAIVKKALAHNPNERYSSAAAFADALEGEFRSVIASHRQVGAFMAAVASEKIQRERDSVRNAPKPLPDESAINRSGQRASVRATGFGKRSEAPIPPAAIRAFESNPPNVERVPSVRPANDTRSNDGDPEVDAALQAINELPLGESLPPAAPSQRNATPSMRPPAPSLEPALPALPIEAALPASVNTTLGLPAPIPREPGLPSPAGRVPAPTNEAARSMATGVPSRRRPATMTGPRSTAAHGAEPPPPFEIERNGPRSAPSFGPPRRAGATSDPARAEAGNSVYPRRRAANHQPSVRPGSASVRPPVAARPVPSPKQTSVPALDGLVLNEEPGAIPDSTMEFNLAPGRRREQVDRAKPLLADNPLVLMPREMTGARKPTVDPSEDATRKVSTSSIAPSAPVPTPAEEGLGVAKFPPLVASPSRDALLYNRWVAGAVLLAVLLVVGFVLTRGL